MSILKCYSISGSNVFVRFDWGTITIPKLEIFVKALSTSKSVCADPISVFQSRVIHFLRPVAFLVPNNLVRKADGSRFASGFNSR